MKKIILVTFMAILSFILSPTILSQAKGLPPFKIIQSDGKAFRAQDLPGGKPVIIIYFSPDCEDCQKFTESMLSRMDDFWKASIVMVTYLPVKDVAGFVSKYKLNIYPNIYVGTEGSTFIVRYYYNVKLFPFVVLLNKNGKVEKIWERKEDIDDLANRLKAL
jgi:thiol-disulfide isomerase/thioredoxin